MSPGQNDQLFAAYFKPHPDVLTSRGANESLLNEAMVAYESANYQRAESLFEQVLDEGESVEVRFYLAQTYLATGEYEPARQLLVALQRTDRFSLKEASQWYLALAYLGQDDLESAVTLLQEIQASPNHAYGTQSMQLLKRIN